MRNKKRIWLIVCVIALFGAAVCGGILIGQKLKGQELESLYESVSETTPTVSTSAAIPALESTEAVSYTHLRPSILVFCGTGNNGADGLAMARMLTMDSYPCEIAVIGNVSHATEEWKLQCHICEQMKIPIRYDIPDRAYIIENRFSVLVDAMLGTGLSRLVSLSLIHISVPNAG